MAGKCKYCSFKFVEGNASKTFQHLQNRHEKLLCIVCNECFKWNEHGLALKAHFKNLKNKHRGFSFCNKKKCLSRIFQTEEKHQCVHPLKRSTSVCIHCRHRSNPSSGGGKASSMRKRRTEDEDEDEEERCSV